VVSACSSGPINSLETDGVFFPRQNPPDATMEALLSGRLQLQDRCLVIPLSQGQERVVPIWPHEFSLSQQEGDFLVLDAEGAVRVREGQLVDMSGGFIQIEGLASLDADVRLKLLDCAPEITGSSDPRCRHRSRNRTTG
jgi:hypothetical protein